MLLLLALLGCNPGSNDIHDDPGKPHTAPEGSGHVIVTRADQAHRPARVKPPTPTLPTGQAVYKDCGAGPWPPRPSRPEEEIAEAEPPPPPTRPYPSPRPRPSPGYAPSPKPAPAPAPPASAAPGLIGGTTGAEGAMGSGGLGTRGTGEGGGGRSGYGSGSAKTANDATAKELQAIGYTSGGQAPPADPSPSADAPSGHMEMPDVFDDGAASPPRQTREKKEERAQEQQVASGADKADAKPTDRTRNLEDADNDGSAMIAEVDEVTEEEAENAYWEWGATVHLSNDDSMSLASAQRVLWSASNKRRPQPSEVRPHELLNYFSFDTVPVPEGELFSVMGAAEQHDDTLSVALAVQGAVPQRQPLDLTLVVDTSGSMWSEGRMDYTRRGLDQMVDRLHVGDRIDLVTFESRVCTTLTDFVVGRDDPALLKHAMGALTPKGSTDMNGGLREAYRIQTSRSQGETQGRNRRVLLITDAMLNTGTIDPNVVSEIGTAFDDNQIRLTGVGVGRDFRDDVLDKLTEKGKGAYVYLGSEGVVDRVFGAGFDSLVQTIAHDVRFSLKLPPSLAMERFYGEEASTNAEDIQPIHYYAGTSQVFLQDLKIRGGELVHSDPIQLRIAWRDAVTGEPDAVELHTTVGALVDGERRNLHKAQALMAWTDWVQTWSMGGRMCDQPRLDWQSKADAVSDDAELKYLDGLVAGMCGPRPEPVTPVAYKVKVDSDVPVPFVDLRCGASAWREELRGGTTVARFEDATPGACTLSLGGGIGLASNVAVPKTGGDVRCLVRGGQISCN